MPTSVLMILDADGAEVCATEFLPFSPALGVGASSAAHALQEAGAQWQGVQSVFRPRPTEFR